MQDRLSNIDILFRDGLKDLEALPPPAAWDNIAGVLWAGRVKRNWLNAAASVAAISALAAATWLTGSLLKVDTAPSALTLNQEIQPAGVFSIFSTKPQEPIRISPVETTEIKNIAINKPFLETLDKNSSSDPSTSTIDVFGDQNEINSFRPGNREINRAGLIDETRGAVFATTWTLPDELTLTPVNKIARWSLGAGLSPSVIFKQSGAVSAELKEMLANEKMMVSFAGGLSISYNINKRLVLSTGINYSSLVQNVTGLSTYTGFEPIIASKGTSDISVTTSSGKIVSSNPDIYILDNMANRVSTAYGSDIFDPSKSNLPFASTKLLQNFGYLELPLFVRYKIIDRKLDLNILGGIAYNILVGNRVHTTTFSGERLFVGETEGLSSLNVTSSMGLGLEYNMPGNISFSLEPILRYYISPIGEQIGSAIHPWSAGVFTGFKYRF
jgi:hypothetical protein